VFGKNRVGKGGEVRGGGGKGPGAWEEKPPGAPPTSKSGYIDLSSVKVFVSTRKPMEEGHASEMVLHDDPTK
jgi:hypothetical protein